MTMRWRLTTNPKGQFDLCPDDVRTVEAMKVLTPLLKKLLAAEHDVTLVDGRVLTVHLREVSP